MESLALDFLNTSYNLSHPPYREMLSDADWWCEVCQRWSIARPVEVTAPDLQKLFKARSFAHRLVDSFGLDTSLSPKMREEFDHYLSETPVICRLADETSGFRLVYTPASAGVDGFLHLVFTDLADLLTSRGPACLKRCLNPACGWVFVDESKNTTRKWCCNTCASLMKVRKFRQIHAADEGKL